MRRVGLGRQDTLGWCEDHPRRLSDPGRFGTPLLDDRGRCPEFADAGPPSPKDEKVPFPRTSLPVEKSANLCVVKNVRRSEFLSLVNQTQVEGLIRGDN